MIDSCGQTHVGLVRSNNEDSFGSVPELGFYVVADGLGGANAGERASKIAVDTLVAEVRRARESATSKTLVEAIELANRTIRWEAENDLALDGMGTTVTAAIVRQGRAQIVNAGDSRAYRLSRGSLECLTTDHTWVQDFASATGLSQDELKHHPYRHLLTKAVGTEPVVGADTVEADFGPGNVLLLCSDGLHGVASSEVIVGALESGQTMREKASALIEATLSLGAPDNVTVLLIGETPDPRALA